MDLVKKIATILLGGALLVGTPNLGKAKTPFFKSPSFDVCLSSSYLAGKAGFEVVDKPVIQSYGSVDSKLGNFYAWSNLRTQERDFNELDIGWTSPALSNKDFGINITASGYTYPNQKDWQAWDLEYGINLFSKGLPLDLNLYGGVNKANNKTSGIYQLSAGKKISNVFSIKGALTYGDRYYSDFSGFSHASITGELSKPFLGFNPYLSLKAQKKLNSFGGKIEDNLNLSLGARF